MTVACFSMSLHSTAVPSTSKHPRLSDNAANSLDLAETTAKTMLAMQSIRSKAAALKQDLRRRPMVSDSHALTWSTANDILKLDASGHSSRDLAEALYSEIDALFALQFQKTEKVSRNSS